MSLEFSGSATRLAPGDIEAEAAALECPSAVLHAFVDTESRGNGFLADKRPVILFERHLFHRRTNGRFDDAHPDISNPSPGGYGAGGDHQYDRLGTAVKLDRPAALRSASWGLGQVLGDNFHMVGFASVETFVAAMEESEKRQLEAMLAYLKAANLVRYLQMVPPAFNPLAAGYNGIGQVEHYAGILRTNYRKWLAHPTVPAVPAPIGRATHPGDLHAPASVVDIADIQRRLNAWGIDPELDVDGALGPDTRDAIGVFQGETKLRVTGFPDGPTLAALRAAAA